MATGGQGIITDASVCPSIWSTPPFRIKMFLYMDSCTSNLPRNIQEHQSLIYNTDDIKVSAKNVPCLPSFICQSYCTTLIISSEMPLHLNKPAGSRQESVAACDRHKSHHVSLHQGILCIISLLFHALHPS